MATHLAITILRRKQVEARTGLARSTIYQLIADGSFPRPINLTPDGRSVGWLESDVSVYLATRIESSRKAKGGAK